MKAGCLRGKVFWWRQFPGILAREHHPATPATGRIQSGTKAVPSRSVAQGFCSQRDSQIQISPTVPSHPDSCQATPKPPHLKRSIRSGNFQSITKDWERDKTHRVSCYFAFQRVNKRLIQWEERKTSCSSAVLSS